MADDREHPDRFTDEELAYLRYVRFGELPGRVAPADLVEGAETDFPHEAPAGPVARMEWG